MFSSITFEPIELQQPACAWSKCQQILQMTIATNNPQNVATSIHILIVSISWRGSPCSSHFAKVGRTLPSLVACSHFAQLGRLLTRPPKFSFHSLPPFWITVESGHVGCGGITANLEFREPRRKRNFGCVHCQLGARGLTSFFAIHNSFQKSWSFLLVLLCSFLAGFICLTRPYAFSLSFASLALSFKFSLSILSKDSQQNRPSDFLNVVLFHASIWMKLSPVFTEWSLSQSRHMVDQVPVVLLDTEHRWLVWFSSFGFIISLKTVIFSMDLFKTKSVSIYRIISLYIG